MNRLTIALAALLLCGAGSAAAIDLEYHWLSIGEDHLQYALALPKRKEPRQEERLLLALPPGRQNDEMVRLGLVSWLPYLLEHGWLVVSPIAPDGLMFFKGAETRIPYLLDHLVKEHALPAGTKFHVFGISNGGISAFRVATLYPERVRSVTAIPGYPSPVDFRRLERIKDIPVSIVVGSADGGWVLGARLTRNRLARLGGDVLLEIIPGGDHFVFSRIPPKQVVAWITRSKDKLVAQDATEP